jgi:P27 family predicted phage terminase small subunit
MKAEKYLSKLGNYYFDKFKLILESRGMAKDEYSTELTLLANEYANYEEAQRTISQDGPYVTYATGAQQISPAVTFKEKSFANIIKLSAKFGMNPKDFDVIKGGIVNEEESELDKY